MVGPPSPAVFFLSDFGNADEFVGVVHAVLHRLAPAVSVIDLSHEIPPFDVGSGAAMLARSVPHLGAGVVLAVVDPGVGTDRRAVAIRVRAGDGGPPAPSPGRAVPDRPRWLVGPDNGLLVPAAVALGGTDMVVALLPTNRWRGEAAVGADPADRSGLGPSFDGRDLFAPAAAHLVSGGDPVAIGTTLDPGSLSTGADPALDDLSENETGAAGSVVLTSATWIDRFGNVQLRLRPQVLEDRGLLCGDLAWVAVVDGSELGRSALEGGVPGGGGPAVAVRRVESFGALARGEMGLMVDANGQVALVLDQASAAHRLGLTATGGRVKIWWGGAEEPGP